MGKKSFKTAKTNQNLKNVEKRVQQKCSICMQLIARAVIDCSHKFCLSCIRKWVKNQRNCPLCRKEISIIRYGKSIIDAKKIRIEQKQQLDLSYICRARFRIQWNPVIMIRMPYYSYFVPTHNHYEP